MHSTVQEGWASRRDLLSLYQHWQNQNASILSCTNSRRIWNVERRTQLSYRPQNGETQKCILGKLIYFTEFSSIFKNRLENSQKVSIFFSNFMLMLIFSRMGNKKVIHSALKTYSSFICLSKYLMRTNNLSDTTVGSY